jgi:hypothetical protein
VPLVPLGFGAYARADRIYALRPLPAGERGPGRRTQVWVEGIPEPVVASRSESAIARDVGGGGTAPLAGDLAREMTGLVHGLVVQVGAVGPLLRREIRTEGHLDLDELEARGRALLGRLGVVVNDAQASLF